LFKSETIEIKPKKKYGREFDYKNLEVDETQDYNILKEKFNIEEDEN